MTDSETLLRKWAATRTTFTELEVVSVEFEHEESYTNDSGTTWPEETTAIVKGRRLQPGQKRPGRLRTEKFPCDTDIKDLLQEIMEAGNA